MDRGWFDEEAGDVVDGAAIDERLEKIGGGGEKGEEADDGEFAFVVFREAEESLDDAAVGFFGFFGHTSVSLCFE